MTVSTNSRLVNESLQPIQYREACSRKSACERYKVIETHKVKLTKSEKYKHIAIVAVLGLAAISFVGIFFLELLSNESDMEIGFGLERLFDSWDKMREGEKTTYQTVEATENKIKNLANKQYIAKIASAEIHFEQWVRNQQDETKLTKSFDFLKQINSFPGNRYPFLDHLPQILKDLGEEGQKIVKENLDTLSKIYLKESDKKMLSNIVKGHFNRCSSEELLQANKIYPNSYQINVLGIES